MKRRARNSRDTVHSTTPHPIDGHVGQRIRERRVLSGMTQEKLGVAIGLTFQQVQKYERGANRVSASRLYDVARALDVPVSYFFDQFAERTEATGTSEAAEKSDEAGDILKRETLEFVRVYRRISDLKVRKRLFDLAKSLANFGGAKQ